MSQPTTAPKGQLIIVAAPSGAGKTSLVKALAESVDQIFVSQSFTTRSPRPGEVHGVHYTFVDHAEFDRKIANNDFLEHAEVFGEKYGTDRDMTERMLSKGLDVILEIDWQGALQVKKLCPDAVSFFILPPSREALETRLRHRQQDSDAVIARRLSEAGTELAQAKHFDYLFINQDFDETLLALEETLMMRRAQRQLREEKLPELLAAF